MVTYVAEGMPADHVAAALAGAGFEVGPFRPVRRTLLDTFDGRLHAAGIRLEVREAGSAMTMVVRDRISPPAEAQVAGVPSTAGDLPTGPLRSRLAPLLELRALLPTVGLDSSEAMASRRNDAQKVVATVVVHDRPALASGDAPFLPTAVEVVPYLGYARAARQAEDLLRSVGLDQRDGDLLALAASQAGIDLRGFSGSPTVALDAAEPALGGFRRVLANLADTIDANWQGTVDDVDAEFLHDFRIAVRRTRAVLAHGKGVLPVDGRDHFRGQFRWLGDITSPPRDLDVYLIEWPGYVQSLGADGAVALDPVAAHIRRRCRAAHATLSRQLRSGRYQGLTMAWRAWLGAPVDQAQQAKRSTDPLGQAVARRLLEAQDRLLARGRAIDASTAAEELHELRKDAKRLRYLLECFGGLLPAAVRKPFVQRLKALQDNLGEHQDTEVHSAYLTALSLELQGRPEVTAQTLLAMGRLIELFERRRQAAREDFAERFAAYDAKPTARALNELIDAAGTP